MKIVVLLKQVPDTTEMKIDKEKGTLIRTGVPTITNPDDLAGLEAALQIKDRQGAKVICVTMGPPQAESMLRELYALGADECVLISDGKFGGADTWATSNTQVPTWQPSLTILLLQADRPLMAIPHR